MARYTLSGTAINGEPFARYWAADKWGSTVPYFSDVPGIYGPYDLAVTCGDLRQEYKVQLIVGGGQDAAELTRLYESLPSFYEFYYSGNFLIHDTEQYE